MKNLISILSKELNVHIDTLYKIRRGERKPTVKLALKLESVTGLKAEAWIFPERYGNQFALVKIDNGNIIKTS